MILNSSWIVVSAKDWIRSSYSFAWPLTLFLPFHTWRCWQSNGQPFPIRVRTVVKDPIFSNNHRHTCIRKTSACVVFDNFLAPNQAWRINLSLGLKCELSRWNEFFGFFKTKNNVNPGVQHQKTMEKTKAWGSRGGKNATSYSCLLCYEKFTKPWHIISEFNVMIKQAWTLLLFLLLYDADGWIQKPICHSNCYAYLK